MRFSKSKLVRLQSHAKADWRGRIRRSSVLMLAAAAFSGLRAQSSPGATETWTAASGDWSTVANWNAGSGHVPATGDTVNIINNDGASRTITYDYTDRP